MPGPPKQFRAQARAAVTEELLQLIELVAGEIGCTPAQAIRSCLEQGFGTVQSPGWFAVSWLERKQAAAAVVQRLHDCIDPATGRLRQPPDEEDLDFAHRLCLQLPHALKGPMQRMLHRNAKAATMQTRRSWAQRNRRRTEKGLPPIPDPDEALDEVLDALQRGEKSRLQKAVEMVREGSVARGEYQGPEYAAYAPLPMPWWTHYLEGELLWIGTPTNQSEGQEAPALASLREAEVRAAEAKTVAILEKDRAHARELQKGDPSTRNRVR